MLGAGGVEAKGQMLVFRELRVIVEGLLTMGRKQTLTTSLNNILKKISFILKSYLLSCILHPTTFSANVIECFILSYFIIKLN